MPKINTVQFIGRVIDVPNGTGLPTSHVADGLDDSRRGLFKRAGLGQRAADGVADEKVLLCALTLGDVVKAIDCSGDFSPVVLKRTDIDKDGDMRAVGPFDE